MCSSSHQCFLCFSELPKIVRSRGRPKKVQAPSELTFRYLLETQDNRYDDILHAVSQSLSSSSVQFCGTCQDSLSKISDLHLELEVIQLRLIDRLQSVREIIIKATSSRPDEKSRTKQSALQKSFETLVSFQNAVAEGSHKPVHIPFVLLERCTNFKHLSPHSSTMPSNVRETVEPSVNVKLEPYREDEAEIFAFDDDNHVEVEHSLCSEVEVEESEKKVDMRSGDVNPLISAKGTRIPVTRRKRKIRKSQKFVKAKVNKVKRIKGYKYICDMCNYKTNRRQVPRFEYHLRTHETPEKVYNCKKCPNHEGFSGKQLYEFHLSFHNRQNGICCDICRCKFDPTELPEHLLTHSGVNSVFQCKSCSFSCASEQKYLDHASMSHARANLVCHICSERFKAQKGLLSHLYNVHQSIKKRVCDFEGCDKEFLNPKTLKTHKLVAHSEKRYICHECGKVLSNSNALKVHQTNHTGKRLFACDECPESYVSNDGLYAHKIREHGAPKLKCEHCDKEYSAQATLQRHVVSVHEGRKFPCKICGKIKDNRRQWKLHMLTHTAPEKLTCKECGKRFTFKNTLHEHMLIHIGDRKFQCSYCPKAFVVEKYLRQHLGLHSEKRYMCQHCGKAFSQPAGLYLHKKNQHKDTDVND